MDSSKSSMEKENVSFHDCYGFSHLNRRSQLRIEKQYKIINQEVKHLQESGIRDVIEGSNLLRSKLKACNNLSKTAFQTASQKCIEYDGEYFLNASEVNRILLNSLQTDARTFDPMVFAEKLITFINPDSRIWYVIYSCVFFQISFISITILLKSFFTFFIFTIVILMIMIQLLD